MRYTSKDGLLSSADPAAVERWDRSNAERAQADLDWTARLRAAGVKLAHPDDGWVDRDHNRFRLSWYPTFNDRPEVGDLIAFGEPPWSNRWDPEGQYYEPSRVWDGRAHAKAIATPEHAMSGYRICRVTEVDDRAGILGGRHVEYTYEDTGIRMPAARPPTGRVKRLLGRG